MTIIVASGYGFLSVIEASRCYLIVIVIDVDWEWKIEMQVVQGNPQAAMEK